MITEEYRKLNAEMHEDKGHYGTSGHKYADHILQLAAGVKAETVLDYGCGKATLANSLPQLNIINYDPCIEQYNIKPEPADVVVCSDVMEHIEPEHVEEVIHDLIRLTKKALFLLISTQPAIKTLPDGRNAHLIIKPAEWWLTKFMDPIQIDGEEASLRLLNYNRFSNHAFVAVYQPWTKADEDFYKEHDYETA